MVIFCEDLTISGNLKIITVIARLEQSNVGLAIYCQRSLLNNNKIQIKNLIKTRGQQVAHPTLLLNLIIFWFMF